MYALKKHLNTLCASVLVGVVALAPLSSSADGNAGQNLEGLRQVALSLQKSIPALVSAEDYRSASNTAFLLATARSRLHQTSAACAALSQSLDYYRKAIAKETGEPLHRSVSGIDEDSDGMAVVRAKFGCTHGRSA